MLSYQNYLKAASAAELPLFGSRCHRSNSTVLPSLLSVHFFSYIISYGLCLSDDCVCTPCILPMASRIHHGHIVCTPCILRTIPRMCVHNCVSAGHGCLVAPIVLPEIGVHRRRPRPAVFSACLLCSAVRVLREVIAVLFHLVCLAKV